MPFTPTHILATLPIAAIGHASLPFSALVIGSMIPDLPLFLPLGPGYAMTHSPEGVLTACVPLGLACFLVFQISMKRPLFALLPEPIQRRCASLATARVGTAPGAVFRPAIAVAIGAATHLLWDSFTHRGRWGTQVLPVLDEAVLTLRGHPIPGYKALQYGSTLVGLPCLVLLSLAWLHRRKPEALGGLTTIPRAAKASCWFIAIAVPAAVAFIISRREELSRYDRLGRSITTLGLALMILTLAYCLGFQAMDGRKSKHGRAARSPWLPVAPDPTDPGSHFAPGATGGHPGELDDDS